MSAFDEFWTLYPRRVAKGHARKAHATAMRKVPHETIQAGLHRFLGDLAERGTEMRFIPHPATWLNGERWADERPGDSPVANGKLTNEDVGYAKLIAAGTYMPTVSDHRIARMVRAGLLTAEQARSAGYLTAAPGLP